MGLVVHRKSQTRLPLLGLILAGILLIATPAGVGILLLRRPLTLTATTSNEATANPETTVSDEVFSSVLERQNDALDNSSNDTRSSVRTDSRIKVLLDGTPVAIGNGEAVRLTDDLQVEVFVAPYPPTSFEADVDLYLTTADGEPIKGAVIDVTYDMLYMDHGPFRALPKELGNGHYLASYDLYMFGPWVLDTFITVPDLEQSVSLPISIYVWPER